MKHRTTKSGFTLVELGLALAFIAMLLLIISVLIISVISIYRKGLAINSVSATGRAIIDDFTASITEASSASPETLCGSIYSAGTKDHTDCLSDKAMKLILQEYRVTPTDPNSLYRGGVFCSGSYSYIWNSGNTLKTENHVLLTDGDPIQINYYKASNSTSLKTLKDFRLIKIHDPHRYACAKNLETTAYKLASNSPDIITVDYPGSPSSHYYPKEPPVDLIATTDNTLALYHLTLAKPNTNPATSNAFISGSFVLATITGGVNIMGTGNYCKPPAEQDSNFDYCAINNFNFATQAIGG